VEAKIEIEKFDDYAIIHLSGPFVSSERVLNRLHSMARTESVL